jgi:hypothetical protein
MLLRTSSHLHARTILEGEYRQEWDELEAALGGLDVPLRPLGPFANGRGATPKRQIQSIGGLRAFRMYPIDQSSLNERIDTALRDFGWTRQPYAVPPSTTGPRPTYLQGDFAKRGVFVEVEFGNSASLFRDLFKFQIAGRAGTGEIGVLVVASSAVASFFDQGISTYEQAESLLEYMKIGLSLPTVIVGLDLNDWEPVERRYEEMRALAEANGVVCHPFSAVRRARREADL